MISDFLHRHALKFWDHFWMAKWPTSLGCLAFLIFFLFFLFSPFLIFLLQWLTFYCSDMYAKPSSSCAIFTMEDLRVVPENLLWSSHANSWAFFCNLGLHWAISLCSGYHWKDLFLLQNSSIDEANLVKDYNIRSGTWLAWESVG